MDVVDSFQLAAEPLGVTPSVGICPNRAIRVEDQGPVYGEPDLAFDVDRNAVLTVPTAHLFPGKLRSEMQFSLTSNRAEKMERVFVESNIHSFDLV